nr:hypothetical protein [Mycolicibacterium fluoranthenivorans]
MRQLAQTILDRLDPAVRVAAARAASAGAAQGQCQQVWCPVCALAALVAGEQHPLLSVIAEHSVALLTIVRAMVAEPCAEPTPPPPDDPSGPPRHGGDPDPAPSGRYEHIPVSFQE